MSSLKHTVFHRLTGKLRVFQLISMAIFALFLNDFGAMNVRTSNCELNEVLSSNITGEVSTHSNCCERLADVNFVN